MRAPLTHASLPCRRIWFCSSCFCSFSVFLSFFIFGHDYGKIRASDFAQPATRALLEVSYGGESVSVSFQDMLGAEGDADTTSLAPASIDVYPLHSPRIIHLFSNSVSQWEHRIIFLAFFAEGAATSPNVRRGMVFTVSVSVRRRDAHLEISRRTECSVLSNAN